MQYNEGSREVILQTGMKALKTIRVRASKMSVRHRYRTRELQASHYQRAPHSRDTLRKKKKKAETVHIVAALKNAYHFCDHGQRT